VIKYIKPKSALGFSKHLSNRRRRRNSIKALKMKKEKEKERDILTLRGRLFMNRMRHKCVVDMDCDRFQTKFPTSKHLENERQKRTTEIDPTEKKKKKRD
jgi:hypothetical protein